MKKALTVVLSMLMTITLVPSFVFAAEDGSGAAAAAEDTQASQTDGTYVLMNIPYQEFYQAELKEGSAKVDAVTSSTKVKPRAATLSAGSYHVTADGSDITGTVYPVKISDPSVLEAFKAKGAKEIKDADSDSYTVKLRGRDTKVELKGSQMLYEAPTYSYYVLKEAPSYYKELTVSGDSVSFSPVRGDVKKVDGVTGMVSYNAFHQDTEIALSGLSGIVNKDGSRAAVSGIVVTTSDGATMGLAHLRNIWRSAEIGFGKNDVNGKTITNIRYYTPDSVTDYPVNIALKPYTDTKDVKAEFKDNKTVAVSGLPADITNAKATLYWTDGTGHHAPSYNVAENSELRDGSFALTKAAISGKDYTAVIKSDNYADIKIDKLAYKDNASAAYTDVNQNQWYIPAVNYAVANSVMSGTSKSTFEPDRALTRAEMAQILYAANSSVKQDGKTGFTDVSKNAWYASAVDWASSNEIMKGEGNNKFAPNDKLTREQMAMVFQNYAKFRNAGANVKPADISSYKDASSVSSWAQDSMKWAVGAGLISGTDKDVLSPQGTSTRAQAAQVYMMSDQKL